MRQEPAAEQILARPYQREPQRAEGEEEEEETGGMRGRGGVGGGGGAPQGRG